MFQTYTNADPGIYSVERADRSVHNVSDTRHRISNTLRVTRTMRLTRTTSRTGETFEVHVSQDIRDGKVHEDHRLPKVYNEAGKAVSGKKYNGYREAALRFLEAEEEQAAEKATEDAPEDTDTPAESADAEKAILATTADYDAAPIGTIARSWQANRSVSNVAWLKVDTDHWQGTGMADHVTDADMAESASFIAYYPA